LKKLIEKLNILVYRARKQFVLAGIIKTDERSLIGSISQNVPDKKYFPVYI